MAKKHFSICLVFIILTSFCYSFGQSLREQIINVAKSQIGISETSENSGPEVDIFIRSCGFQFPVPWCGCYVGYVYDSCVAPTPDYTALAANWFPKNKMITELDGVYVASTVGVYFPKRKGIHHVGIVEEIDGRDVINISGNTSDQSINEGDVVARKRWPITQNIKFSDWIGTPPPFHTVKFGDTMYKISNKYKISLEAIKERNSLGDYEITVGQKIWLN